MGTVRRGAKEGSGANTRAVEGGRASGSLVAEAACLRAEDELEMGRSAREPEAVELADQGEQQETIDHVFGD